MHEVAKARYYKVERIIADGKQQIRVEERWLLLFNDSLHTKHRRFVLEDVYDVSCRMTGEDMGMLYLHTKQGVFMYSIKEKPQPFIAAYKQLKTGN